MSTCVAFNNVSKRYRRTVAVDGLSLEVATGEVFGLLGPNGAGKTTTLHMLTGLVRPTSGTIQAFGKDARRHFLDAARRTGVLVERPAFYEHLSVENNIKIQARLAGRQVSINRVLDLVGILHTADWKVSSLSQGMRKRLGLAQAMVTEPELLVLDEPTAGLDIETTQEILQLLRRLADEAHVTILISSHQLREVEILCDRVAILNQGRLVSCERTDALLSFDLRCLEVIIEGAESAAKRLSEQRWVESAEIKSGRLQVRLVEPAPQQLIGFLVSAGYQVSGVIPRRRTLHDYFLRTIYPSTAGEATQES